MLSPIFKYESIKYTEKSKRSHHIIMNSRNASNKILSNQEVNIQ